MLARLILVIAASCLWAGTARAQLFLEEGKVTLAVSPGDRISKSLTVHNTSSREADVKIYWEDFKYKPPYDGAKDFSPSGTFPDSMGSWITFAPQSLQLPPKGQATINYVINVPDHVDKGHYGALFFEETLGNIQTETGLKIVTRVGCLFFVEPHDKTKTAELKDFKTSGDTIKGAFANGGNVTLIPKTTYYIMNKDGMVKDRGDVKSLYVPAGAEADFEISLPAAKIDPGEYSLVINADLEEGDVAVKEIELSKDSSGTLTIQNVKG